MNKRVLRALSGEAVWPPPLWLMRQAGRHLPEYRALRAKAGDFLTLCLTPEFAAEVTLQPLRRYGMDAAILFSDILVVPWALGVGLRFEQGEGPILTRFADETSLAALRPDLLAERLAPVLAAVRRLRTEMGEAALIGFAGAPFTLACYMVEGGGSKDHAGVRALAYRNPSLFGRLIELLATATEEYLSAQIEAGAEAVMLFDSWAGVLPPALFHAYVIAPTARIVAALRTRHPRVPVIGFPRMASLFAGLYARRTAVQAVGLDTSADPAVVAAGLPAGVAIQGNLDPVALLAGGDALAGMTRSILAAMRGRPFIFNLGHGILPETSPEHVAELVRLVRNA